MRILFYGRLGERLGRDVEVDVPPGTETVGSLRGVLAQKFPGAARELLSGSRACVADQFVGEDFPIVETSPVEFMPPLSGG